MMKILNPKKCAFGSKSNPLEVGIIEFFKLSYFSDFVAG
jgi:hypothetical protein